MDKKDLEEIDKLAHGIVEEMMKPIMPLINRIEQLKGAIVKHHEEKENYVWKHEGEEHAFSIIDDIDEELYKVLEGK